MAKKILCFVLAFIILTGSLPLCAPVASATDITYDQMVSAAASVVRQNEGYYSSVNPDDNGSLSVGWLQWHGNRALNLLKDIVAADTASARSILGNSLYNEITTSTDWSSRVLTSGEAELVSNLISTNHGMTKQDELAENDLSVYISHGMALGITDPTALVYYADLENQCGAGGAKRIGNVAISAAGGAANVTLDHIHNAALADSVAGRFETRRQKTYTNCLLLGWGNVTLQFEVWDILAFRNIRETADTQSAIVTSVGAGSKVIVTEKIPMNGTTRAKTTLGWLTLDDASATINPVLSTKTVAAPTIFRLDGGYVGAASVASTTINAVNVPRTANTLIVYNCGYSLSTPVTNAYGTEVAVDGNGKVLNDPTYGTCKVTIPSGGFVISGIGTGYSWLASNVKKNNYIEFDERTMTVYVYGDRDSYNASASVNEKVKGTNIVRTANSIVVYDNDYIQSSTTTNAYGTEVAVDANGKVLNSPTYGKCKTSIPNGGFVVSGIGTGYSWMYANISEGDYIQFDRNALTVKVFHNKNAYLESNKATHYNAHTGDLPTPAKDSHIFTGWKDQYGNQVASTTVCPSGLCLTLTAQWTKTRGETIVFDTQGGSITDTVSREVDGRNTYRGTNTIIVYDSEKGSTTGTNIYGTEAIVGSNGFVTTINYYGKGDSPIPEGGFVISGNGTGSEWVSDNISVGMQVVYHGTLNTIIVCENSSVYDALTRPRINGERIGTLPTAQKQGYDFMGWYTADGTKVTENTIMGSTFMTLYAKWQPRPGALFFNTNGGTIKGLISSSTLAGTNIPRANNTIVLYKDRASTGTNTYGCEVVVGKDGIVDAVYPYGSGNCMIPNGSFVLSGIGSGYNWLYYNVSVGNYISVNSNTVSVWADKQAYDAGNNTTVTYGNRYSTLPVAEKAGYSFIGWTDENGKIITSESIVYSTTDVTLFAKWEKLCAVTFDEMGGKIVSDAKTAVASGINVSRKSNSLVIYAGLSSTGTNSYGREVVIDKNGIVTAVYPYGTGNTSIPDGCTVLSGIGTMDTWIRDNISKGNHVKINGYNIKVYESYNAYDAEDGTLYVKKGSALDCLPKAQKPEMTLLGWISGNTAYTKDTKIYKFTSLCASWKRSSATLIFDTNGGSIKGAVSATPITAVNTSRTSNSLVLYDISYGSQTYTNAYGTEVAVDSNGRVLNSPSYGTCKLAIPEGGFVLSGIGTMYSWLFENVKAGNYIHVNRNTMTVTVYETAGDLLAATGKTVYVDKSYGALPIPHKDGYVFTGWYNSFGDVITEGTTVTNCDVPVLTAHWQKAARIVFDADAATFVSASTSISGTNIHRSSNTLVLYRDKATTGTNIYGAEVVIEASTGKVVTAYGYGKGNNVIPDGCYVLSGIGTMCDWVLQNLTVGSYVTLTGNTVAVYKNKASLDTAINGYIDIPAGTSLTELPIPFIAGYTFEGWYDGNNKLTVDTVISYNTTFVSKWS